MDLYSSFAGFVELSVPPGEVIVGVGMICEIVPALCCVDEFIHLVSMVHEAVPKMLLVSQGLGVIDTYGYGLYATDVAIQILQLIAEELLFCPTCVLLGQTFARCSTVHSHPLGYTPKQGEFLPSHLICKLLNSSTKDTKLRKFGLVGWNHVSTLLALNLKLSPDIGDLQLDVSSYHLFDVVCRSFDAAEYTSMANVVSALHIVNNLVFLVLLQQSFHPVSLQRWSQDYDLIRQTIVAHFGWFGSILEFLYGSLPRPPDILYVFNPKSYNSYGVFKSKMQVPSILRGSIRIY